MINFASLFNQYRNQSSSGLNDLLEQQNLTMGRVLDDDSFLGQYKSSNPKVTKFLTYSRYSELVDFVTIIPGPEDKKRAYKYPLAACDVLSLDVPNTLDFFLPENTLTVTQIEKQLKEVQVEVEVEQPISEPSAEEETAPEEDNTPQVVPTAEGEVSKQKAEEEVEVLGENEDKQGEIKEIKQIQPERKVVIKKQIRKQMQEVENVISKEVPPLINKLLEYFKGEVNYTLAGYVSKILTQFLNKKPGELMKYLFEDDMTEYILNHAESRSVGDFLLRVITYESPVRLAQRSQLFKDLLQRLSTVSEITTMSNLSAYACEIIEKLAANLKSNNKISQFSTLFLSLETVTTLINGVMSLEEDVSIYNAPVLLTYLTTVPFTVPQDEKVLDQFTVLLTQFVEKSLIKLNVNVADYPKLGVGRVKIVEILKHIVKEDILGAKNIIAARQQFFPTLYKLMLTYDLNNLLHNEIIRIIEIALTDSQGSPLNNAILKDDQLLNLIVRETTEDKKIREGHSTYRYRKGYIAHLINLCLKLKELAPSNSSIKQLTQRNQFISMFQSLIQSEIHKTSQNLAGYSMKKDLKHQILFQKEDILNTHLTFFQKCPAAVFEQEIDHLANDHINIEHPDLLQEMEKQLQQNVNSTEEPQEGIKMEKDHKESENEQKKAEYVNPSQYWVTHLNYEVDDLLADL